MKKLISLVFAILILAASCKKKEEAPAPVLYKTGYDHKLIITGTETLNAGTANEDNIIWILNNTGADIRLKDYTIKEKSNSWILTGDDVIIHTTDQYNQHCSSINQTYDQLSVYNSSNSLIFTFYK